MVSQGHWAGGRGWWLAGATGIAVASGLIAAWLLMRGNFAAGIALLMVSIVTLRWPQSIWLDDSGPDLSPRERTLSLLAVCAIGIFFRVYRLEPPGIWGDDAINGLLAFDVLDGKITSPFQLVTHSMSNFHALTNYTIAGAFWAFGAGPVTLRLPGIVAGVLCIPLLYGIAAPLFGARVALLAALLFASSPMQVTHSKVLVQVVLGQLFLMLGLWALVRGLVDSRRWLIAIAGVPCALCLCTYHSAKLAPLVAVPFLAVTALKAAPPRRQLLRGVAGFGVVLLLCSLPAVVGYVKNPGALTARIGGVALWPMIRDTHSLAPLWEAVWRTLMIFQYQQGPEYHWMGIGSDPAFNMIVAFLFVHGLVQSLRHCLEPRHMLLLTWVAIGLVPGLLSAEAPRVYRVLLATPPLFIWAALPVAGLLYSASAAVQPQRWVRRVAVLLVLAVPLIDFNYYFYRVYTHREFRWFQAARMLTMARTLRQFGPDWVGDLLVSGFDADYESLRFLSRAWGLTIRDVNSLADVLPVRDLPKGGILFMMDKTTAATTAAMRAVYPSVTPDIRLDPQPRSWWLDRWLPLAKAEERQTAAAFFPVSRATANAIRGVVVSFFAADGTPIATRVDAQIGVQQMEQLPSGPIAPTQVRWSGAIFAPADGRYEFKLESGAQARVWIDGIAIVSHDRPEGGRDLAQGLHRLAADATVWDLPVLRLQWQPPGSQMRAIAPDLLFRDGNPHGLLAEYEGEGRALHRIEPYPYYAFFPPTFTQSFNVRWRGHLRIPPPGGYRLEIAAAGRRDMRIDGHGWQQSDAITAGTHDLDLSILGMRGAAHLQIHWIRPDGGRELVPAEAFTPPYDVAPPAADATAEEEQP